MFKTRVRRVAVGVILLCGLISLAITMGCNTSGDPRPGVSGGFVGNTSTLGSTTTLPTGGVAGITFSGDGSTAGIVGVQGITDLGVGRENTIATQDATPIGFRLLSTADNPGRGVIDDRSGPDKTQVFSFFLGFSKFDSGVATTIQQPTKPDTHPQIWHRDRQQPTMARVYVGDGNSLELVSLHVTTTIEGPRARTVVDHIFRNPHGKQLEGTFEYPLPNGASPSYFAMFLGQSRETMPVRFRPGRNMPTDDALARLTPAQMVKHVDTADWGDLREGRVVNNEKALDTYEETVRGKIDPALLEYAGGNTFRGRVFPIAPKGYNRVILAYEETLPILGGEMIYKYDLPGCQVAEMLFTLHANNGEWKKVRSNLDGREESKDRAFTFMRSWTDAKPKGSVVFACTPNDPRVQAISGRQGDNGPHYVYARIRPNLPAVEKGEAFSPHAVFLLDTSLSEHPDRFAVSMRLLKRILEDDPDIKTFNVLAFNVGASWVSPGGWLPNTPAGREALFAKLDGLVLEGATDLSRALDLLAKPGWNVPAGTHLNCFVLSDGNLNWGETDIAPLVARFEKNSPFACRFHCYRTGLGAENQELYDALTRKGGGVFNCYGEADIKAAAQAHRNHCLQVEGVRFYGKISANDLLVSGRRAAVYPGGELLVAAKTNGQGMIVLEGTFQGKKFTEEYSVDCNGSSELAPRAWGEIAVASLLALNDPKLDELVTAYCQQFGIGSRVASFLVLENEADYKRLNLERERGKTLNEDMGEYLDKAWTALGKIVTAREAFGRFLSRVDSRVKLLEGNQGEHVKKIIVELLADRDFEIPAGDLVGGLTRRQDVTAEYLDGRKKNRREVATYLTEGRRRAEKGDVSGAVCVLSSIIEENPGRSDALRLVGYRLLDLNQPAQAARLFEQVLRQRPFEPHSYRDLARSLEDCGLYGLAAVHYEIILAGTWHNRFRGELALVAREEYVRMMQEAIRKKAVSKALADHFGERLEKLAEAQKPADLRVTISWNTDATDIDLWVIEPNGEKCFYQNNRTKSGGELSADQTQGYGPERYQTAKAKGEYKVMVHYFRDNPNLLGGETHVNVVVTRFAGTPRETVERHTVILKKKDEAVEVCRVKY